MPDSQDKWSSAQDALDENIRALTALINALASEKTRLITDRAALQAWADALAAAAPNIADDTARTAVENVANELRQRLDDGPPGGWTIKQ